MKSIRKQIIKNNEQGLNAVESFWKLHKANKSANPLTVVRNQELMKQYSIEALANHEIEPSNKYYDLFIRYSKGETVLNSFGKKLYFKLGEC